MARPLGRPLAEHVWWERGWYHAVTGKPFSEEVYIAGCGVDRPSVNGAGIGTSHLAHASAACCAPCVMLPTDPASAAQQCN